MSGPDERGQQGGCAGGCQNPDGLPSYNHEVAASLGAMGVPAFGCTPDAFPDLIAAAIQGEGLGRWAEQQAAQ